MPTRRDAGKGQSAGGDGAGRRRRRQDPAAARTAGAPGAGRRRARPAAGPRPPRQQPAALRPAAPAAGTLAVDRRRPRCGVGTRPAGVGPRAVAGHTRCRAGPAGRPADRAGLRQQPRGAGARCARAARAGFRGLDRHLARPGAPLAAGADARRPALGRRRLARLRATAGRGGTGAAAAGDAGAADSCSSGGRRASPKQGARTALLRLQPLDGQPGTGPRGRRCCSTCTTRPRPCGSCWCSAPTATRSTWKSWCAC
jgi:hypothetical protein